MAKPSLCKDFLRASWWTWHFMKRGYNLGLLPGEETITDNLLIYLAHRHQKQLRIYRLNKSEESKYGADWEWWFHTPQTGAWLGMRVQAKKLNPSTLRYESLGKAEQVDNLINQVDEPLDTFIRDVPEQKEFMVPVYVFYNYWCLETACKEKTLHKHDEWICSDAAYFPRTTHPCEGYPPGCTMADAYKIRELVQEKGTSHGLFIYDVYQGMFCWADLVCRSNVPNDEETNGTIGFAEHVERVLRSLSFEAGRRDAEAERRNLNRSGDERRGFLITSPPVYVQKVLRGEALSEEEEREADAGFVWVITGDDVLQSADRYCCLDPPWFQLL